jgi:hypothetical protein
LPPELPPRPRVLELRGRDDVLRFVVRLAAPPGFAPDLELARVAAAVEDLARGALDFLAPLLVERLAVEPLLLRAPELRDDDPVELERDPPLASSSLHLPESTRCAASATASAISDPSLVALAIMLLAACDAVSAASRPASRIARRAFGLALIAAAAAASPAASISLLIAALASLSTVVSLLAVEPDEPEELDEPLRADLAIASSPVVATKDTQEP